MSETSEFSSSVDATSISTLEGVPRAIDDTGDYISAVDFESLLTSKSPSRNFYPTCETGEYQPPWVSGRRANLKHCLFYRLPEEIVLDIMGDLDYVSKAMALRTCGLFLRISFDPSLSPPSQTYATVLPSWSLSEIRVWPAFEPRALWVNSWRPEATPELRVLLRQVRHLLDRDRFCDGCRRFREDGRYKACLQASQGMLWCSFCNQNHRRMFFSAHERQHDVSTAVGKLRLCILGEGKVKICPHWSMGWDDDAAKENKAITTACGAEPCEHRPVMHHPRYLVSGIHISQGEVGNGVDRSSNEPRAAYECPPVSFFTTTLFLSTLCHKTPVTRAWLQEQLTGKADVLDQMSCHHVTASDGQLLIPFGPDRCACFGSRESSARCAWIPHSCDSLTSNYTNSHTIYLRSTCCRCKGEAERVPGARKPQPTARGHFLPREYEHLHKYTCAICNATYNWIRKGSDLFLEITKFMGSMFAHQLDHRPHSIFRPGKWLYTIHPESWGILQDEELRHVAWCEDFKCMTGWRWERLSRLWEM